MPISIRISRILTASSLILFVCTMLIGISSAANAAETIFNESRPRVITNDANFSRLKELQSDPLVKPSFDKLMEEADFLNQRDADGNIINRATDPNEGGRLTQARQVLGRVHALSAAYILTGDVNYRNRLWHEVGFVSNENNFPNWGEPGRSLDMAEFGHAVALAYDWFYDEWNTAQRDIMRAAMVRNVLEPAQAFHNSNVWWSIPSVPTNWNMVSNAGFLMVCAAIGTDNGHSDIVSDVYQKSLASFQRGIDGYFDENGGILEGIGYWTYAMEYLGLGVETLISSTGNDFGIMSNPGLAKTGDYFMGMHSNTRLGFGHGDSDNQGGRPSMLQWVGGRFNNPLVKWYGRTAQTFRVSSAFYFIMFYADQGDESNLAQLPLLNYYPKPQVVTMRSSWTDLFGIWAAIKGGDNQDPHNHLDLGTFVFQSENYPWFVELGQDSYSLPGYFLDRNNYYSPAWDYYRLRTEGQNTILLSPGEGPGQQILNRASVFNIDNEKLHTVVNLSEAYRRDRNDPKRVFRGMAMLNGGEAMLIRDHLDIADESLDYYWLGHTQVKNARFIDQTRRAFVMYANSPREERLLVYVKQEYLQFEAAPDGSPLHAAEPLPGSPRPYWDAPIAGEGVQVQQNQNVDFRKIILRGQKDDSWLNASVIFYPLEEGEPEEIPELNDYRIETRPVDW